MIRSFDSRKLKRLYEHDDESGIGAEMRVKIRRILSALDAAQVPNDMALPGFHLHPLKGDRRGQWAVTVRANWRVVFWFEGSAVHDVDLIDYHGD